MAGIHNLGEVIARDTARDVPWVIELAADGSERTIPYAQLHAEADAIARGLLRRGLVRGARVGLLAANSATYLIAYGLLFLLVILVMPRGVVPQATQFIRRRRLNAAVAGKEGEQQIGGVAGVTR